MTGLSGKPSSAFDGRPGTRDALPALGARGLHLWLAASHRVASSDDFKRQILSLYTGIAPSELAFVLNGHGKPGLAVAPASLDFNLSHSGDWLACILSAGAPVGVDLQACDPARVSTKVARRFFRDDEATAIENCSGVQRDDRFYDLWTLKEAAVKARGGALAPGLAAHGFELTYPAGRDKAEGRITVTASDGAISARYALLDPVPDYRLALCWLPDTPSLPELALFELQDNGQFVAQEITLRARSWLD